MALTEAVAPSQAARGQGLFVAGAVTLIVFGLVHTLAVYNAHFGEPATEQLAALDRSMREATVEVGPFTPSAWGAVQILNESYAALLVFAGLVNLMMRRPAARAGRLRALAGANASLCAVLLASTLVHQFPPPMLFAGAAMLCFGGALLRLPPPAPRRTHPSHRPHETNPPPLT